jgi:hypothetical protein
MEKLLQEGWCAVSSSVADLDSFLFGTESLVISLSRDEREGLERRCFVLKILIN